MRHSLDLLRVLRRSRTAALAGGVLHQLQAASHCDRALMLDRGRTIASGPVGRSSPPGRCAACMASIWCRPPTSTGRPTEAKGVEPGQPGERCGVHVAFARLRAGAGRRGSPVLAQAPTGGSANPSPGGSGRGGFARSTRQGTLALRPYRRIVSDHDGDRSPVARAGQPDRVLALSAWARGTALAPVRGKATVEGLGAGGAHALKPDLV